MPQLNPTLASYYRWLGLRAHRTNRGVRTNFRRALSVVLALIIAAIIVSFGVRLFHWQQQTNSIKDPKDRVLTENEIAKTLAQAIGGAIVLVGLYFTYKTVQVAQEGQITERFNKAIDHLGSEKLEIRLGGVYALARIARDSAKDHWAVMQVFCAFVRDKAVQARGEQRPPADVQAILTLLADRDLKLERDEQVLDFSGAYLVGADLREAQLRHAAFRTANLQHADFLHAQLDRVDFADADLRGARLREVSATEANFTNTNLEEASLRDSTLRGASLLAARMHNTSLLGADLRQVIYVTRSQLDAAIVDQTTKLPIFATGPEDDPSLSE